jgi:hypothetical protein
MTISNPLFTKLQTSSGTVPVSRLRFDTTSDHYLTNNSEDSTVASIYGWPIGVWDVSEIEDFSYLFSADASAFSEHFNPAAATFNDDISHWTMESATSMISMFDSATTFNLPIGNWTVSSATTMGWVHVEFVLVAFPVLFRMGVTPKGGSTRISLAPSAWVETARPDWSYTTDGTTNWPFWYRAWEGS